VFVVGKGGVGKTTTAGALAVAAADAGQRTHLLSTDPAHSVGDLFQLELPPGVPTNAPCAPRLALEELDAKGYADVWIRWAREPLLELIDRGTYLDPEDIRGFLELSLPGVDEIGAVLRLTDLAAQDEPARVVIDTAPTGHTLRLLDVGSILQGWRAAFAAMEEKADAVLTGLFHRRITLAAHDVILDLERRADVFQREVVQQGAAVVVERRGRLVEAESERLRGALAERGLEVGARVLTLPPGEAAPRRTPGVIAIPWREGLVGCEKLREWGSAGEPRARRPVAATAGSPSAATWLGGLGVELILFVGKGGVGKTTCAAAAALGLAADRRVVLLGTDPAGSLADVLDRPVPPEGAQVEGVRVREIQAGVEFAQFRDRYRDDVENAFARLGAAQGLALDRRVVASLLDLAPPGADELFAVMALLEESEPGSLLVVDAAPTGHLLRLLEMPGLALDWTRQLMRVLVKYRATLGLDAFAERLLDFAKQLKGLNLRLHDPARTAAVVVSLEGPLVAAETERLERRLVAGGVQVRARIRNRATGPDDGERAGPPGLQRIRAPLVDPPPVGAAALADFFRSWTLARSTQP
jgi:arsenite-transporting ATPase